MQTIKMCIRDRILGGGIVAFVTVFVAFLLATPDKTLENIPDRKSVV